MDLNINRLAIGRSLSGSWCHRLSFGGSHGRGLGRSMRRIQTRDQLGAVVGATEEASVVEVATGNDDQKLKNNKCKRR
jgi:hypothetical protein